MIIIELQKESKSLFEEEAKNASLHYEVMESKKLGGEEIMFQILITAVSIATPYIVNFFSKSKEDGKTVTFIKDGIRMTFENDEELKKYLDSISESGDDQ